ncbi:Hypothetical protein PBC10988_29460 [Planctomycetales bacterium 10988]|nr:Hypothetical protein PBC10988_29460 [Planctomycetales bacterium 10988]
MQERQEIIYRVRYLHQAWVLKQFLEDKGIDAVVIEEDTGLAAQGLILVNQKDADRARSFADQFDEELRQNYKKREDNPLYDAEFEVAAKKSERNLLLEAWPLCPGCRQPRLTWCPYCKTSGTDFPPAYGMAPEHFEKKPNPAAPELFLMCPTCDEPFVPKFYRLCTWCDYDFGDGIETESGEQRPLEQFLLEYENKEKSTDPGFADPRVIITFAGLFLVMAGMILFFYFAVLPK